MLCRLRGLCNFVFFTPASTDRELEVAMRAVRGHKHDRHRFSPMILMARDLTRRKIKDYVSLGLDDIVQFPCSLKILEERLKRQLFSPQRYFETADYFGPDRRRDPDDLTSEPVERKGGGADYRRYTILRNPYNGVQTIDIYDHVMDEKAADAAMEEAGAQMEDDDSAMDIELTPDIDLAAG